MIVAEGGWNFTKRVRGSVALPFDFDRLLACPEGLEAAASVGFVPMVVVSKLLLVTE